ncbi:uncharacterized protein LOC123537087 [Mercenaria mercenaria]|uniref:uncharacterized protein LOC123537087 n=1 Tax=Mercenaria mercenaria TaxID=6596 RepID=UPI00234E68D2|nr:uncharacterized protein LOC123537087 [Mercenaria mercenaria]
MFNYYARKKALPRQTCSRLVRRKMSTTLLSTYIQQLEEHAKPGTNDRRYMSYVKYINAFLSCFGKERAYLVGSTGEQLKLRRSQNDGDVDFLLCSGRLEIPIDNIEERPDLRCYIKIRGDNLRPDLRGDLIDGYLSADILRDVRPELFTILRAIYTEVTSNDTIPRRESRVTMIGVPMKVGLGTTEFRNLEIDGDILPSQKSIKRHKLDRDAQVVAHLKKRWRSVQLNMSDMKTFQRILKIVRMTKVPGSKGENHGKINKFADLLESVMQRIPLEQEQGPDDGVGHSIDKKEDEADVKVERQPMDVEDKKVKATFSGMKTKDFVPALRVVGDRKLNCLVDWRKRVEKANWPPRNIAEEIFNTDIFLVARDAPVNPDHQKDFCLSFNLAEMKLGQCLSTTQRRVYLILKSYLSGILQRVHMALGMKEMKFKTYYLKTAFFWVCEREDVTIWSDQNIITAIKKVLHFLLLCLREKKLSHYFVNSNLFAELDELNCDILQNCIQEILCEPVDCIGEFKFIKKGDNSRGEIWLTANEVQSLTELGDDGGRLKHLDKLEDAMIDMQRGFNGSTRDAHGRAPIKEAILKVFDIFLEEERQKQITNKTSDMSLGGAAATNLSQSMPGVNMSQTSAITGLLNNFVTGGGSQSMNSREANERMDFLVGLGSLFRGGPEIIANLGGREGVQNVLQQSTDQSVDYVLELRTALDKYLSCGDEDEERQALELKQKVAAYFIGRQE